MTLQERTPVPILQHDAEFETLLKLYKIMRPHHVLEVGTYHGGTFYHWLQNADQHAKVVTLDSYAAGVDNRPQYMGWLPNETVRMVVLEGNSMDPVSVGAAEIHGPYDWLFIDAGHFYQEVLADWNNYKPMVVEGGVICLHDILTHPAHPEIEVGRLWDEIKSEHHTFEIIADPFAEWGGIGVVLL